MKKLTIFLIAILSFAASSVYAKDAYLSMIYTNALGEELPFSIFSRQGWSPDAKARFVKLHLYFDEPIMVNGVELDTCGTDIKPDMTVFFNFDQYILHFSEPNRDDMTQGIHPEKDGNLLKIGFDKLTEVRSLTFNFESNKGFKVCGINIKDQDGKNYNIKTPVLSKGSVEASSVLYPSTAYDPIYLFDSRYEYGWATNKQAKDVNLNFNFDMPKRIEEIRIWNGYQRSIPHCYANSRARKVVITGDDNYREEIFIEDELGSQRIKLPKPFIGKNFKFEIVDSFIGKTYQDLVISELRFFNGQNWFMLDPTLKLKEGIAANRAQFAKSKVDALLNDSYHAESEYNEDSGSIAATLRLRADGSFYMSGYMVGSEESDYFALGNYEIIEADASKGLKLRLFGLYNKSEAYGDCNGCGRDCNRNDVSEDGSVQKIFQEFVTIKPSRGGKFEVVNKGGGKKIKFKKLMFERESGSGIVISSE